MPIPMLGIASWRYDMNTNSALLAIGRENHRSHTDSSYKEPEIRSFYSFDVSLADQAVEQKKH